MFKRKHLFANHVRTSNEKCNNISKTVIQKLKNFSLRGKDFICIHSPIQRNKCYNSSWRNIPGLIYDEVQRQTPPAQRPKVIVTDFLSGMNNF